jgi:hypothetical protein
MLQQGALNTSGSQQIPERRDAMTKRAKDDLAIRVFISHSWMDKQMADQLARELEPFADVWMDWRNLRPGDPIQETIDKALGEIDVVLVVWTENAAASEGVDAELRKADDLGVRIVPCIFSYDAEGNPKPAFSGVLAEKQYLGVDFHHHRTGVAKLATMIADLQRERLPKEASTDDHPGTRLLSELQAYLGYLANFRKLRGTEDQRSYYVNRIIEETERYLRSGGNADLVRALLESAKRSEVNDPEGIGMLVSRLEKIFAGVSPPEPHRAPTVPSPSPAPGRGQWKKPAAPPRDELAKRVAQVVPAGTTDAWLAQLDAYIESAPPALQAMTDYAWSQGSQAGAQVTAYLQSYLNNPEDLIPDREGRYGLIDDSWLILNTAFRLIESGILPAAVVPLDWRAIIQADYVARSVMPPQALAALTQILQQMLQTIAAEVSSYQPWFTPQGHGYSPVMAEPSSVGGCWEDQMNEMLLGTGLSV